MARATAITNTVVYGPNVAAEPTANVISANTAFYVEADQLDERTVFEFTADANATLTIAAGTGYAGVNDLAFSVDKDDTAVFTLDSARYIIASGENAGLIKMTSTAAGSMKVIQAKV